MSDGRVMKNMDTSDGALPMAGWERKMLKTTKKTQKPGAKKTYLPGPAETETQIESTKENLKRLCPGMDIQLLNDSAFFLREQLFSLQKTPNPFSISGLKHVN